ncbi:hypothetical protein F0363_10280 [Orientia tsutsugamushi]|nr:hypothetical protein F0363_10280 [Orientia tsutsugamushi]
MQEILFMNGWNNMTDSATSNTTCNCSQSCQENIYDAHCKGVDTLFAAGYTVALLILGLIAYYYKNKYQELERKIKYTPQSLNVVHGTQVDCYFSAAEEVISECRVSSLESNNVLSLCNYNCEESLQQNPSSNNQNNNEEHIIVQQNPTYFFRGINANSCTSIDNNLFPIDDSSMVGATGSIMMGTLTGNVMDDLE